MAESWVRSGAVVSTAFLAGAMTGLAAARYCFPSKPPLRPAGIVSELFVYPIKSMRGISVPAAQCTPFGLKYGDILDRSFVVTDNKNHFITARQEGRLVLIQPSFNNGQLVLNAPEMETIRVDIPKNVKVKGESCRIWGQDSRGIDCGREVGAWIEKFLNRAEGTVKLLYHPWETRELVFNHWKNWERFKKTDMGIYPDAAPFMTLTESSIADLNSRLEKPVTVYNFRPNILIKDTLPYEEDAWKYLQLGEKCLFRCIRPTTRCVFTTVDPETGVRGEEPLKTLKSYRRMKDEVAIRREGDSPVFGQFLGIDVCGQVTVGDPVFASV